MLLTLFAATLTYLSFIALIIVASCVAESPQHICEPPPVPAPLALRYRENEPPPLPWVCPRCRTARRWRIAARVAALIFLAYCVSVCTRTSLH